MHAIVGIDPGVSTAVAILDLRGGIVSMKSSRGFSLGEILEFISRECSPLVIASDVLPAPKLISKVAAAFSTGVYEPDDNFSRLSKSRLVRPYEISERERHKKDALAAAVSAYESKLPFLRKIEKRISERGLAGRVCVGEVASMILSGECSNIHAAIEKLEK